MGLDTTHGAWHGSYSAFSRWRDTLAVLAGYRLADDGYLAIDWTSLTDANLQGEWDTTPDDPLLVLIAHSDCGGAIQPAQAGPLADRIEQLLPLLPEDTPDGQRTRRFIGGLRSAAAAGEAVEFS